MGKLPVKVNSIIACNSIIPLYTEGKRNIYYIINRDEETRTNIHVQLPEFHRPEKSDEIIDDSNNFVNGFKVVQTSNGEYAYVREADATLLPYRYDVAFDFNEYGFAIVGKEARVSWIDKDFKYFNRYGDMVEEPFTTVFYRFIGWHAISNFSKGSIPLSQVFDLSCTENRVYYFGVDGKLRKFYKYDGEIYDSIQKISFREGTIFDENGHAFADDELLFAKGYYITLKDITKLCLQKGLIDSISEDAEKCFDKETGKVLKKELKPNK